ncbi:hypothetical protein [Saccharopolyspora sp. SCSIO 74807]|uniref:hypothetical protein n=1 Tax=Saccharopolyspora sp. SCSIO 74807 TaxID=3118084 RepID=UPI0030D2CE84
MPLIIARHRAGSAAHFFDVEQQNGDDRKALCGFACGAGELVQLQNLSGVLPCELCIRDAPDDQLRPTREAVAAEVLPSDDEDSAHTYAVGLRGEFVWHDVPEHPVMQLYQGREVVITECGCIAFLVFGTPPERYARCPQCPAAN